MTWATKPVLPLSRFPNSDLAHLGTMKASPHAQCKRAAQEVEARSKRGLKQTAVRSDDLCSLCGLTFMARLEP